jgi:uncharacterized membrane protein
MLVCLPFVLALVVLGFVAGLLSAIAEPVVGWLVDDMVAGRPHWLATTVTILVALILFAAVGWLAAGRFGRMLLLSVERLIDRMPLVGKLYSRVRQVRNRLAGDGDFKFRHFVLAHWNENGWLPAFVTGETNWPDASGNPQRHFVLFIPNTHLLSGSIRILPAERVRFLNVSVEDGVTAILTAGLTLSDVATEANFGPTPGELLFPVGASRSTLT